MNTAEELSQEQQADAARSRLYYLLALAFSFPGQDLDQARSELRDLAGALYPELELDGLAFDVPLEELESEYINVFDGVDQSRYCKPYEGLWMEADRAKRQWEVKKFYGFFGLDLNDQINEMPDHLMYELEFMHFLSYRATVADGDPKDPNDSRHYLQAQRDFLERHLSQWLPAFRERLEENAEMPFYRLAAQLAERFVLDDLESLRERLA